MNSNLFSLRKKLLTETKHRVREDIAQSDVHIVRAVNALSDLDATANLLAENCKEWYQTAFPELERTVNNQDLLLKLIRDIGNANQFSEKKLEEMVSDATIRKKIVDQAQNTAGTTLDENTLKKIQLLVSQTLSLRAERKQLESFVEKSVLEKTPNFGNLATPIVAGRMIAKAGSIERLVTLPASALQVQGAEKALFAHLRNKKKVKPPKHGFLFNHPLVQKAPLSHRGKMARSLAAKLSICLKADRFGKNTEVWKTLQAQLEKRLQKLQKQSDFKKEKFSSQTVKLKKHHH